MKGIDIIGVRDVHRLLLCSLFLLASCDDHEVNEIYLEGEPIPGIEIFFPLGFYDSEPLMPKISPDGTKLLFSGPASLPEWKGLWVMDLETQQKTLIHSGGRNGDWARDNEWIVFNIADQVYKVKKDASELTQLTFNGRNFFPDWNPIGEEIVISGTVFTTTIDVNGNIIHLLEGAGGMPDWMTDTTIIGFKGFSSTSTWTQLTVYDLIKNEVVQVMDASIDQDNRYARASPNNLKITFWNTKGIYVMNNDGSQLKRIIPSHLYNNFKGNKKLYCNSPSWYPDSEYIIYDNFKITKSNKTSYGIQIEGIIRFCKVRVEDALATTNLK